jgi:serine/threonine protein kinase/tetratricopeptide (TPR) repeat protein
LKTETSTHWERVDRLFAAALQREAGERQAFIARSCGGDEKLRHELDSLLRAFENSSEFMQRPVFDDAVRVIGQDEEEENDLPQQIGPYRVERQIGRGGMGTVYLAVRDDGEYRREVALKVVKRGMDTDFILQRFRSERRLVSGFDHPNIARLWDGGVTEEGLPYFAMEYVEGAPIDRYCDRRRLTISERLKLFQGVCSAVQYAHQRLVVHRDLKPGNILVTPEGVPKLLDFGIAKLLSSDGDAATMTALPLRVMTPEYASPEQVRGEMVTTAADVYSLGVILYELLTGHPVHEFPSRAPDDIANLLNRVESEKPSTVVGRVRRLTSGRFDGTTLSPQTVSETREGDPQKLRRRLRGDLDNIVLKAIRLDPRRRYASVTEFSDDIRRHLKGLPVMARRDTFAYRAGKFVRRNRLAVSLAALALLALVGASIAVAWEAHLARQAQASAERRLEDVRRLAHTMLFDYNDALKGLRGASKLRAKLVNDALLYLDGLSAEASGDPDLQRELAAAYEKVGDLQALPPKVGDIGAALKSYRKSVQIRERFAVEDPLNAVIQGELAGTYRNFAHALWQGGDTAGALDIAMKALAIQRRLNKRQPNDVNIQSDLVRSYLDAGEILQEQGQARRCEENFSEALKLADAMKPQPADNLRFQGIRYLVHEYLGELMLFEAKPADARHLLDQSLALMQQLDAAYPDNFTYRHNSALIHQRIGEVEEMTGDLAAALQSFGHGVEILEQITQVDPAASLEREKLAEGLFHLGLVQAKLGRPAEALRTQRKALALREEAAAANPADAWTRAYLVSSAAKTASLLAESGDLSAAAKACAKVQYTLESSVEDPTNMSQKGFHADALQYLGDAHAALARSGRAPALERVREWQSAREYYEQALSIWIFMRENDLLYAQDAPKIAALGQSIAVCDSALQNTP